MRTKIVELDLVEWEPLHIRFVPDGEFSDLDAVIASLQTWLADNSSKRRADCDIRYYRIEPSGDQCLDAFCEHLTPKSLRRLVNAAAKRFPELDHVEIGEKIHGCRDGTKFDWIMLPAGTVKLDVEYSVEPFAISFTAVTIGQFLQFMDETSYVPAPDLIEDCPGYLVDNFRLNHGKSSKLPLFGVTFDDASAYCDWAGLRLPTEPELQHFFVSMVTEGRTFKWSGECWTTTSVDDDMFVVRDGPYRTESLNDPLDRYRKVLHRHHYQYLEAPCFRVANSMQSRGR